MKVNKTLSFVVSMLIMLSLVSSSCEEKTIPKPRAYFRIDIPEHTFREVETELPLSFEYADYARIESIIEGDKKWLNVVYDKHKAYVYLSYFGIENNLPRLLDDAHGFAYKHISKATDIDEQTIIMPEKKVYGLLYSIKGSETATPVNFYLTDSTRHFLRGALYFNLPPNNDSLAPVIQSIESDIVHLVNSLEWKTEE